MIFFRRTYFNVLKFHVIDSGEVREEDVQMYERTGSGIASDYREVIRNLRGVCRLQTALCLADNQTSWRGSARRGRQELGVACHATAKTV